MKLKTVALVVFICQSWIAMAGSGYEITFDSSSSEKSLILTNDAKAVTRIRHGHRVVVHLKNLNPIKYKYTVSGKDVNLFVGEMPAAFKAMIGTYSPVSKSAASGNAPYLKAKEKLIDTLREGDEAAAKLLKIDFQSMVLAGEKGINESYKELIESVWMDEDLQNLVSSKSYKEIRKRAEDNMATLLNEVYEVLKALENDYAAYTKMWKSNASQASEQDKTDHQNLDNGYLTVKKNLEAAAQSHQNLVKWLQVITRIMTEELYERKESFRPMKDLLEIEVKRDLTEFAKKSLSSSELPLQERESSTYTEEFNCYGRSAIDFSLGLAGNSLIQGNYYLQTVNIPANGNTPARDAKFLRQGPDSRMSFGATAYAHYIPSTFNLSTTSSWALSLGLMSDGSKTTYLVGPSVILGRKNRMAITAGLAFGNVKRLSEGQIVGAEAANLNTVDVLRTGFFLGVSFTIGDR